MLLRLDMRPPTRTPIRPLAAPAHAAPAFSIWRPRYALLLILALAAFLRFFDLTTIPPPLHFDEAMNGNDAMENLETGHIDMFYPQNGGREGLYINIETALIYLFGPEPWLLRLPAAVFGTLTVWGVYLLAAELFSVPIGLLACFFVATSFWHVLFSRLGLRAIAAPFFAVWTLYFLLDAMRRALDGRPAAARVILAAFLCGMGFYTYIAYRVTPALVLLVFVFWFLQSRREALRAFAVFTLAAVVTVAPLAAYFVRHPDALLHRSAEISIFNKPHPFAELLLNIQKTILMIFARGDFDWRYNSVPPVVFWPVAILFAAGLVLALVAICRRRTCSPQRCCSHRWSGRNRSAIEREYAQRHPIDRDDFHRSSSSPLSAAIAPMHGWQHACLGRQC